MEPVLVAYHPKYGGMDFGTGHPFGGDRFRGFLDLLAKVGGRERINEVTPPPIEDDALLAVHSEEYVAKVRELEKKGGYLSMDTPVRPGMEEAARYICGGSIEAARLVTEDDRPVAVNFGGFHHAGRDYGEGFCVYNDVAAAALWLLRMKKARRVMVLDTDAHQGNGTMDIFYGDHRVLFVSTHQDPRTLYPGKGFTNEIGDGEGRGYTVNIPMPVHAGIGQYKAAYDEIVDPLAREFEPDVVIRNGGSDPHFADELTQLGLDFAGLRELGRMTRLTADRACGRLVDLMVSGYGKWTPQGWLSLFSGVTGMELELPADPARTAFSTPSEEVLTQKMRSTIQELKDNLQPYWSCFG